MAFSLGWVASFGTDLRMDSVFREFRFLNLSIQRFRGFRFFESFDSKGGLWLWIVMNCNGRNPYSVFSRRYLWQYGLCVING